MDPSFEALPRRENLHHRVVRLLALRVIESDRKSSPILFPKEDVLCQQLGVSRTVLRESMKVLADKGMVELKPRAGTRALPRSEWHLLDPDILEWQAEFYSDSRFLRDLCEVRLAIEPTAAGFAALRAAPEELAAIERCLEQRESMAGTANLDEIIDLDLEFHGAVVAASHNPLLEQLSVIVRRPFRTALSLTSRFPAAVTLGLEAHRGLLEALRRRDPLTARSASEQIVGLAMLAVEEVIRSQELAGKAEQAAPPQRRKSHG